MKPIISMIVIAFLLSLTGCSTTNDTPACCTVSKTTYYSVTYDVDPYRVYYLGPAYPYKLVYEDNSWF